MRRDTEKIVLFLVGVALVVITFSGTYTRYVKPAMLPWLISAAVILVLAGSSILRDLRPTTGQHPASNGKQGHEGHRHHSTSVWLLTIPIVLLGFVPPALDSRTAPPTMTAISNDLLRQPFPPLPDEHATMLRLTEVLPRITADSADALHGHLITVTGFTVKNGDATDLSNIVMSCCAGDAQLAGLRLTGPAAASATNHPENTWLTVRGTVPAGQQITNTNPVPEFRAELVTTAPSPKTPCGTVVKLV